MNVSRDPLKAMEKMALRIGLSPEFRRIKPFYIAACVPILKKLVAFLLGG